MTKLFQFFAVLVGVVAAWYNNLTVIIQVMVAVMVLDTVLGVIVSFTQKTVTAKEANNSLARKVGMIILMLMVGYLSRLVAFDFPLVDALGGFFIYNETLSILENATILGVPIPQWLRDALERISPQGKIATNARLYGARRATDEVNTQPPKSRRS